MRTPRLNKPVVAALTLGVAIMFVAATASSPRCSSGPNTTVTADSVFSKAAPPSSSKNKKAKKAKKAKKSKQTPPRQRDYLDEPAND